MAGSAGNFKEAFEILSIKSKYRHDSLFDHYSRVLVKRILIVATILVGVNWFNDKIQCAIPPSKQQLGFISFVSDICWLQGYYVYDEIGLNNTHRYYGIPDNIYHDGRYNESGELCSRKINETIIDEFCKPMEKHHYRHYQYIH